MMEVTTVIEKEKPSDKKIKTVFFVTNSGTKLSAKQFTQTGDVLV